MQTSKHALYISTMRMIVSLCLLRQSLPAFAGPFSEAGVFVDATQECRPYDYPLVDHALASFPPIWTPASIVRGDTEAAQKWAAIRPNVPNIPPKGTTSGEFSSVKYPASDPDCWWTYGKCTTPKAPGLVPDIAVMPEPRTLGYGFDDGPNCSHSAFYDYLSAQRQTATMFYIGSNVMNWPVQAQRAVRDGHEICAHTWSHHYMTSFTSEDAFAELYYSKLRSRLKAIKLVMGVTPTCWRPPFGDIDDRIRAIAHGMGLRTVLWKYDSNDWQVGSTPGFTSADADAQYQKMISDAESGLFDNVGTIILAHELNAFTMAEAIKYYPLLKQAFTNIVPIGTGMNVSHPYLENNYTMPTYEQYTAGTSANDTDIPTRASSAAPVPKTAITVATVVQAATVPHAATAVAVSAQSGGNIVRVSWTALCFITGASLLAMRAASH